MLTGSRGLIENQISDWIRRNVCIPDKERGRCKKIVIRHLNSDRKPKGDVHTVNVPADPAYEGTEVADKIVADVAEAAQRDADDCNAGVQMYAIYAYYTNDPRYCPRKIFRVAADDEMEPDVGPSEPPNEKGLTTQLMRHLEITSKNSLVAMGYILQTFQKEIEQQRSQNRIFMQQQIDMTILVQETLDNAAKRRIDERSSELQTSMVEGVYEHLKVALPILANRLAGKEVFPAKMDRELYILASLLEGLDTEQQQTLQGMLKPGQMSLLAELLGMYEERKHKFQKEQGETDEDEDEDVPADGKPKISGGGGASKSGAPKISNVLLRMFEKRKNLVNTEKAAQAEDQRAKRIEDRAKKISARLVEARKTISNDGKE